MWERIKQFGIDLKEHFKTRDYRWKYKLVVCLPIFVGLLIIDIVTKQLAFKYLSHDEFAPAVKFIDGFINFKFVINRGIAFGVNSDNLAGAINGAVFITLISFSLFLYLNNKIATVGLIMITTGGFGNLIDRMWNDGGVVDFLTWELFPPYSIFNFADMCVTLGVVVLVIAIIVEIIRYYYIRHHQEEEEENE
ncbi:hypothetical protein P344_04220 [Spiroplasma mirum ATCC 29335]|uniref:Lipoprotein signal peptidase n=1 Tax=Spiroplasma mirum ATCC 29335 TaxID=838561 RepID=W0GRF2_9MOLU|nr:MULTISPECIES: signal peptidase II [Spiroplasma]AHF61121.1 putative signal peptidase II [Spiroplasma mirum ATCC 29335]AHI58170.1 hypothetical protein P344_04220 [Spiroplasma mirum ATCC 29335]AKM53221.1 lipoprotein signal peptidase [Spiroplasma atrichopogonis]